MRTTLALILTAVLLKACASSRQADGAPQVDAYLSQLTGEQAFSGAVLIARDGETLLNKGYGWPPYRTL